METLWEIVAVKLVKRLGRIIHQVFSDGGSINAAENLWKTKIISFWCNMQSNPIQSNRTYQQHIQKRERRTGYKKSLHFTGV